MQSDLAIKKIKKLIESADYTPAEKTLILKLFFSYGFEEFETNAADLASKLGMNVNTLILNVTRLKRLGLLVSRPLYSDNGAGRCGSALQLKKF